ncbi:PP-loop domain-containing protein, partial [mine drainage metagenome]
MECSRPSCGRIAILDQPYAGAHLCREHFRSSVWERFRRQMHRQAPGLSGGVLAVALSGGKDSSVVLSLLARFARGRPDLLVTALTIDEGIEGYRPATVEA